MRREILIIIGAAVILIGQSPVFAQTFRTYNCYDGSQFILAFFEGDNAHICNLMGRPQHFQNVYLYPDHVTRKAKTVTTLKRGKQSTECITRSWLFPGEVIE